GSARASQFGAAVGRTETLWRRKNFGQISGELFLAQLSGFVRVEFIEPRVGQRGKLGFAEFLVAVVVCLRHHLRRHYHPRSKPASTTAGSATTAAEARSAGSGKGFIRILRQDVEAAFSVLVNAVIARTNPVAVVVDQRIVERKKFQRAVDI